MAGSLNKVLLIGNLGADPEVRQTNDGRPVVNLRIATTERWRSKSTGEMQEKTEWHRVVVFNENICRVAENYLKKGSKVYIEGALQTRKFTDQQGVEKFFTEVVLQSFNSQLTMLDTKGSDAGESQDWQAPSESQSISQRAAPGGPAPSGKWKDELQDDVPFGPQVL